MEAIAKSVEIVQPLTAANCSFLNESKAAASNLALALWKGMSAWQENPEKGTFWQRLTSHLPGRKLGKKAFETIYPLWNRCLAALQQQNSHALSKSISELVEARKIYPYEFKATVAGMDDATILKTLNYFKAMSHLFATFDAARRHDTSHVKQSLAYAVRSFQDAGIPKDDPSLANYQRVFLAAAADMRITKQAIPASA